MLSLPRSTVFTVSCVFILASLLTACGGGGAGSLTSSSGSSAPGSAPAAPKALAYTGTTTQAQLTTANAYGYQQLLFTAIQFLRLNVPSTGFTPKTYDQTINGSAGTAVLTGVIKADGTGWIQEQLNGYESSQDPGVVENGIVIIYVNPSDVVLGFEAYSATIEGVTYVYNGSITSTGPTDGASNVLVGTVSVTTGSQEIRMDGLTIRGGTFGNDTITGNIYDSAYGYVSVDTVTPALIFGAYVSTDFPDIYPTGTGEIKLEGAGDTSLDVQLLNGYFLYLGLDSDGDGNIDVGARLDRTTGKLDAVQPAGATLSPLIVAPNPATIAGPVTLDGRYSYAPNDFVSYSWSLVSAPLGSAATLSGTGPTAQFTPDVLGDYQVELTASNHGKSASDVVTVSYTGTPLVRGLPPIPQYKGASYIHAHVGDTVTLDGRASPSLSPIQQPVLGWVLGAPIGSHARIADKNAIETSFKPDVAGIYYVILGADEFGDITSGSSIGIVAVDEDLRLGPLAAISSTIYGDPSAVNTGTADSLATMGSTGSALQFQWWTLGSDGLFAQDGSVDLGNEWASDLVQDLNGDGIPDLVTATSGTGFGSGSCPMDLRVSGAGSYTLSTTAFAPDCNYNSGLSPIFSTTLGGKPAIVGAEGTQGHAGTNIVVIPTDGSGNAGTPVLTAFGYPFNVIDFALGDMDGDSKTDLIAVTYGETVSTQFATLYVYTGDDAGHFALKSQYSPPGLPIAVTAGDFNGDGKMDVALISGATLYIYYGDGAGNLGVPDTRALTCESNFLKAVDLNNDGHADLVVENSNFCATGAQNAHTLGMFLSGQSHGHWSLGNESFYPLYTASQSSGTPIQITAVGQGNYSGNNLQGLMLREGTNLMYVPQLPATTSATILTRPSPALSVPTAGSMTKKVPHKVMPRVHVPILRPDAAPH